LEYLHLKELTWIFRKFKSLSRLFQENMCRGAKLAIIKRIDKNNIWREYG